MKRWSKREIELLRKMRDDGAATETIASALGRSAQAVSDKAYELGMTNQGSTESETKEGFSFKDDGPTGYLQSLSRKIRTLDDLMRFASVDLSVWEVERFTVNRWECVMREPATTVKNDDGTTMVAKNEKGGMSTLWTRDSKVPVHEPLYQIKAWLKKKSPQLRGGEELLKRIAKVAPLLKPVKFKQKSVSPHRSLELCIMDPHVGLLCQYPEGDASWDLDLAANYVLKAIDELVETAKVYGPFCEIFAPFGNDFVHSDNVFHTTTQGTPQPEAISWHRVYDVAESLAIEMVNRMRQVAPKVCIYEVPGNHSRISDFTLARILRAYFHSDRQVEVTVHASSSPYKFHRAGVNLIGYEHGHSVKVSALAGIMANECRQEWGETHYHEWHLGDQHRKGGALFEEQGVSAEYVPGITAPNEWHRLKGFNHQQRGAMAFVWDHATGPVARLQFNISKITHQPMTKLQCNT